MIQTRAEKKMKKTIFVIGLVLLLASGQAFAATFTPSLNGVFPIEVKQGETKNGAFSVDVTATGNYPGSQSGAIVKVCKAVTLNNDGTGTCTSYEEIQVQNGRPPANFPQSISVALTAVEDVACATTYQISVLAEITGSPQGTDFGNDESGTIRFLSLPFTVNVLCPDNDPEGCSHGYWKTHTSAWEGYAPDERVDTVFQFPESLNILKSSTLLETLSYPGGSTLLGAAQILLRQAVAAILNAEDAGVYYPRTVEDIVDDVNEALLSESRSDILGLAAALDGDNNLPCPLD
jgi:hypothetical protein